MKWNKAVKKQRIDKSREKFHPRRKTIPKAKFDGEILTIEFSKHSGRPVILTSCPASFAGL